MRHYSVLQPADVSTRTVESLTQAFSCLGVLLCPCLGRWVAGVPTLQLSYQIQYTLFIGEHAEQAALGSLQRIQYRPEHIVTDGLCRALDRYSSAFPVTVKIDATRTRLGAAEQKLKAWLAHQESRKNDQAIFDRLPSLEKKLAFDEAELEKWKAELERLSGQDDARNRKGLVHELALALFDALEFIDANVGQLEGKDKADALLYAYQSEHGALLASEATEPEGQQKLPQAIKAHGLMVTSVAADKRAIEVAKAAGSRLESQA